MLDEDPNGWSHIEGKELLYLYDLETGESFTKIVNIGDYDSMDQSRYILDSRPEVFKGATITLNEPGYYLLYTYYDAWETDVIFINVVTEEPAEELPAPKTALAEPTKSNVLVNGQATNFEAYKINNNNYFKLRDLAYILNGTSNQFEVEWDGVNQVINLIIDKPYAPVGGEMTVSDDLVNVEARLNESKIHLEGQEISLTAYTINGNNYFKLRDVGEVMGFRVTWDEATQTIGINTWGR